MGVCILMRSEISSTEALSSMRTVLMVSSTSLTFRGRCFFLYSTSSLRAKSKELSTNLMKKGRGGSRMTHPVLQVIEAKGLLWLEPAWILRASTGTSRGCWLEEGVVKATGVAALVSDLLAGL